jgi:ABC-type uncharacterized transport system substrate-binding protein
LGGKRLELLRDAVPGLARVAMLWNPEGQERAHEFEDTAEAARALGLELQSVELRQGGSLDAALAEILQSGAGALFLQTNQVTIPGSRRSWPSRTCTGCLSCRAVETSRRRAT